MVASNPAEIYGRLLEGAYVAGHEFERACSNLEWLLQDGRWRKVGPGFNDVNAFLGSIRLDNLRMLAEQRKRIAQLIKGLEKKASNRAIAKVVGANEMTIRRDTATNVAPAAKIVSQDKGLAKGSATNVAPPISGVQAAKLIERRTNAKEQRLARVVADEQRVLSLLPIVGKFRTIVLDPAWDYDWLSLAGRAKPGYAMQTHEELLALDVRAWADEAAGCHLYLWTTNNFMGRACELVAHWGFQHRTVLTWIKPPPFGLGSYFRNSTEHVIFATLGDTTTRPAAASMSTHFEAPRGEHSEKPECFYDMVRAASYPPYGEGNQREPRSDFSNLFVEHEVSNEPAAATAQ